MKRLLMFFLLCLGTNLLHAQVENKINDKWLFLGNAVFYFNKIGDDLYVEYFEGGDDRFEQFYHGLTAPTTRNKLAKITVIDTVAQFKFAAEMNFNTGFRKVKDTVEFAIYKSDTNKLTITGKLITDKRFPEYLPNKYCDTANITGYLKLYGKEKIAQLKKLKTLQNISKVALTEFLDKLEKRLPEVCNKCSENVLDAEVNEIVINMGYNPISVYQPTPTHTYYKAAALYQLSYEMVVNHRDLQERYVAILKKWYSNK